jgi:hypothetical protein
MYIIKKFIKIIAKIILALLAAAIALLIYFNFPVFSENKEAKLGVTFSKRYAEDIGLNWKEAYIAVLDDLKIRKIRIPVYWDLAEPEEGRYDYADIDWQLQEAGKRNAEIILTIGQKVPRWPECAIPAWASVSDQKRKASLMRFIDTIVKRYKNYPAIKYWQIENEPFLPFGICPALDVDLLDSELNLVRSEKTGKPIIVTDSGELSLWVRAASRADVFGTTMYRTIYKQGLGYFDYPIGPRFFQFKALLNKIFAHQENNVVIELQAEPWISGYTTNEPLTEQFKSMDSARLANNVSFARKVGFPEIYLWGAEWWYWLKVNQGHPELWDTAKNLFNNQ